MSRAIAVESTGLVGKSIALIFVMLISSFSGILMAPTASAMVSGDYELTESLVPLEGEYISSWDPILFEFNVTNSGFFFNTEARVVEWFICEGELDVNACISANEDSGSVSVEPIAVGASVIVQSANSFSPDGGEGVHTLIYRFQEDDTVTSNDILITTFHLTQKLVDVNLDYQNPITQLENLNQYEGEVILNTGTDYDMTVSGIVTSCGDCNLIADIGWKLLNETGSEVHNSTIPYSDLPSWGEASFTRSLPALNYSEEGRYTMVFGLLSSSGNPVGDMNSYNDLESVEILFDDTVDLQVTEMYPRFAPTSSVYYYGNDSIAVVISNLGNMTVYEPLVRFTVMDLFDEIESEEDCRPEVIIPGDSETCIFDIQEMGDKHFKVYVNEVLSEGSDAKPSDNILTENAEVVAGGISPIIDQSNYYGLYNTGDSIEFSARTSSTAAAPLDFSWWIGGIFPLGTGQTINISAEVIGLGDHFITTRVTDSLGSMESDTIQITVFNSSDISTGDWLSGYAVTRSHATGTAIYDYPVPGFNYGPGAGLDSLLIMSVNVEKTDDSDSLGMDYMEFDLNLTNMLPSNIPYESVRIRQLHGLDQIDWDPLNGDNTFELINNNTIRVHLTENMDLLIVGELPPANITPGQPEIELLPDGFMRLDWDPVGDLNNPYFGGWQIYRLAGVPGASSYFPDPETTTSEFVWNGLMANTFQIYVASTVSSWDDPTPLETGECVSYAIMPANRAAEPAPLQGEVTIVDEIPGLKCGDAINPTSEVSGLSHSVSYNNDTSCFNKDLDWFSCYEMRLTWTWPDHEPEGNITWNMYRLDAIPNDMDLRFIEPIATGLVNVPGEAGEFWDNGTDYDGIRPYRTYYYILTPLDWVGNEETRVDIPSVNIERVHVDDVHWSYNDWRIPEPPPPEEPPMGVQWLGDLEESMEDQLFQISGAIMLAIIMINFIGLPLLLKKRKRLAKVIAHRIANAPKTYDDDEFDEFF